MTKMLFVGECQSLTAKRKKWTWKDGHLAAKPLFAALEAMGIRPLEHEYMNLWQVNVAPVVGWQKIERIRAHTYEPGHVVIALGKRVSAELTKRGIEHVALVHPAARGKIRKRERYHAHVAERLSRVIP